MVLTDPKALLWIGSLTWTLLGIWPLLRMKKIQKFFTSGFKKEEIFTLRSWFTSVRKGKGGYGLSMIWGFILWALLWLMQIFWILSVIFFWETNLDTNDYNIALAFYVVNIVLNLWWINCMRGKDSFGNMWGIIIIILWIASSILVLIYVLTPNSGGFSFTGVELAWGFYWVYFGSLITISLMVFYFAFTAEKSTPEGKANSNRNRRNYKESDDEKQTMYKTDMKKRNNNNNYNGINF